MTVLHFLIKDLKNFKRLYISTGSTFDYEIKKTAEILKDKNFIFLHCVTIYPTPLKQINFLRLNFLKDFQKCRLFRPFRINKQ